MGYIRSTKNMHKLSPDSIFIEDIFMPPFEEEEVYCFANVGRSVCRSVGLSVGRPDGFR